ncbi:MAG: hypothetical protein E7551_07070 [Ruminococcaceae bacterium]|nr:hypothetical protein [Oscillospiraceae bacterium]
MKKFLAILFSVVILATFMAVPAFAAGSPEGDVIHKVEVIGKDDTKVHEVKEGDTIELTKSDENFEGWEIDGDYDIVSGTLTSDTIVIRPNSDLTVTELYKDTVVEDDKDENESDKAPTTGNGALMVTVLLTAGAFVAMVATKKAVRA